MNPDHPVAVAKRFSTEDRRKALVRYREILLSDTDPENDFALMKELERIRKIIRRPAEHFTRDRCVLSNHGEMAPGVRDVSQERAEVEALQKREAELKEELQATKAQRMRIEQQITAAGEADWRHRQTVTDNPLLFGDVDQWLKAFEWDLEQSS